jgi:hypothetical protein
MLENKGEPSVVQRTLIRPPEGRIGPLSDAERRGLVAASPVFGKYEETKDRDSAHEMLGRRAAEAPKEAEASGGGWLDSVFGSSKGSTGRRRQGVGEMIGRELQRSFARTVASTIRGVIMKTIRGR